MTAHELNEEAIFNAARMVESTERRLNYVKATCGGDDALFARIVALLKAHEQGGSLLSPLFVAPEATVNSSSLVERPGAQLGPYKLLQQIGEGGMGTVFMAEQSQPVKRKVALKVVKPGMDSRQVIARFEAERQALAMMDHVNIARVLDAGTSPEGRPYFVMELVQGVPITKYCDDNRLTPRQRLELFMPVCHAIAHAHQKGIIHRDIKPSNVMVTLYDGRPVPKVIDFGVAKATEQTLTERTLFTQFGTMVGTLEYMSPEQAEMSALGVDTRSDIYSLGVLLYELLTGSTPLSNRRMKEVAYAEILRLIKEEEPPKPSTRLSESGEALASIAAHRQLEPTKLTKLIRGELDWIAMKALDKDRNRRYETAGGFAADVRRYLDDQPVHACPPSALYRFQKFARRNKAWLAIASTMALAALVAIGSIGWVVRDRSARGAKLSYGVEVAMHEAGLARERGSARTDNPYEWDAALAAARSALSAAEELADQDAAALDPALTARLDALRASLDADEADRHFVARFDEVLRGVIVWDAHRSQTVGERTFLNLKDAFSSYFGWRVGVTAITDVVKQIHQRPRPIQAHLLAALDVALARVPANDPTSRQWLANVLESADSDAWRKQARASLAANDWAVLEKLLKDVTVSRHSPALLHLFASSLPVDAKATKTDLLRRIREAYPGDFWAHNRFKIALSHHVLAWQLANPRELTYHDEQWAVELALEAVQLIPSDGDFWSVLGLSYYRAGRWNEAVAALKKATELSNGGDCNDWLFLALAHWRLDHQHESRQWYEKAVEWMDRNQPKNEELRHFRDEAETLLGIVK